MAQNEPEPKGFGKPQPPAPPKAAKKRRSTGPRLSDEEYQARRRYEEAEQSGKPAFEVFVREVGQEEWKAAGAIASPANMIERAIFDSEEKLLQSVRRQYTSLRKAGGPFEFGYRRKDFPDDPVQLAKRPKPTILGQFRSFLADKFGRPEQAKGSKGKGGNRGKSK